MESSFEVVVVSSDLESRQQLEKILAQLGHEPVCLGTLRECREVLAKQSVGLVFCDAQVSDGSYRELMAEYRAVGRKPRLVVTSRGADWDEFKDAMRWGVFDVISAPCRPTDVEWMVIQAKRDDRLRPEVTALARRERAPLVKAAGGRL